MRILFLTLDIFKQTGGIQQVNKLLSGVLTNIAGTHANKRAVAYTYCLYDTAACATKAIGSSPTGQMNFSGNKIRFLLHALHRACKSDLLILSHIHLLPLAVLFSLLKPGLRMVMLAHGAEIRMNMGFFTKWFLTKRVQLWAVSTFTAERLKKINPRLRVDILHNALSFDFSPPARFGKPEELLEKHILKQDQEVLLSVCRIGQHETDKGIEQVIRTLPGLLPSFPALKYFIAGPTEANELLRLKKLVDRLRLQEQIIFLGFVPQSQLSSYYLLADVFVMPSRREGFGLVYIEAAACGCRIIAGNIDGSKDALLQGKIGTLIDPNSISQLHQAITKYLREPWSIPQAAMTQAICLKHFSPQVYEARVSLLLHPEQRSPLPKRMKTPDERNLENK